MIIDIVNFIKNEKKYWNEFEEMLNLYDKGGATAWDIEKVKRFHYLYEKISSDLIRISTLHGEQELGKYLESLVGKGYSILYSRTKKKMKPKVHHFITTKFPQTFRKNFSAFVISVLITLIGVIFGAVTTTVDKDAKAAIFPEQFSHLHQSPSQRVEKEESNIQQNKKYLGQFAANLMTHNIKVSITTFVFGVIFGVGTVFLLFYNGIILGAVMADYIMAGETTFLLGWLLPHGIIEIPSILIAGQAGLILGSCILRLNGKYRLKALKEKLSDMATLIIGLAMLLVWAGIIEAFFSQYHEPIIPYSVKIIFGIFEGCLLFTYLFFGGRGKSENI